MELYEIFSKLGLAKLGTTLAKVLDYIFEIGSRKGVVLIVIIFILSMLSGLSLISIYYTRSGYYQEFVQSTLVTPLEPTSQSYKGMEAFLLSVIPENIQEIVKDGIIGSEIPKIFKGIQDEVVKYAHENQKRMNQLTIVSDCGTSNFQENSLKLVGDPNYISDCDSTSFLFLPPLALGSSPSLFPAKEKEIKELLSRNPEVLHEIAISKLVIKKIEAISDGFTFPIIGSDNQLHSAKQAYIITGRGLNRILIDKSLSQSKDYYTKQFHASTYFPQRPYFREVMSGDDYVTRYNINDPPSKDYPYPIKTNKFSSFFYVTKPYIDIGGYGLVLTVARGIIIDGLLEAVICFDIIYDNGLKTLESRILGMGGNYYYVTCPRPGPGSCHSSEPPARAVLEWFFDKIKLFGMPPPSSEDVVNRMNYELEVQRRNDRLSAVFGNINVFKRESKDTAVMGSVPLARSPDSWRVGSTPPPNESSFFVFWIDPNAYRLRTTALAFCAFFLFVIACAIILRGWARMSWRRKDFEEAFNRLHTMMEDAPIGFVRLDSEDRIITFNQRFKEMLSYEEKDIDYLFNKKFRDLCADEESKFSYDEVQKRRAERKPVKPYSITMFDYNRHKILVDIYSAAMVADMPKEFPSTFGLVCKTIETND